MEEIDKHYNPHMTTVYLDEPGEDPALSAALEALKTIFASIPIIQRRDVDMAHFVATHAPHLNEGHKCIAEKILEFMMYMDEGLQQG